MTSSACPNCSPRLPNEAAHTLNRVLLLRPRPVPSITKPVHHWNADHPEARTRQNRHFFSTLIAETHRLGNSRPGSNLRSTCVTAPGDIMTVIGSSIGRPKAPRVSAELIV